MTSIPKSILITSLLAFGVIVAAGKMYLAPVTTPEPSIINCFNYLGPTQAVLLYGGAVVLGVALLYSALAMRRAVIVYLEALIILSFVYTGFVAWTAFDYSGNGIGLALDLGLTAVVLATLAWVLRVQLAKLARAGVLS